MSVNIILFLHVLAFGKQRTLILFPISLFSEYRIFFVVVVEIIMRNNNNVTFLCRNWLVCHTVAVNDQLSLIIIIMNCIKHGVMLSD